MINPVSTFKRCALTGLCATGMLFSVASQAIMIDDFNVDTGSIVFDNTPGDGSVTGPSAISGATVMDGAAGWTRTLTADLTSGDFMSTEVCSNCQAGHVDMSGGNSSGIGTITYSGGTVDMSMEQGISFSWGSDLDGSSAYIVFSDANGNSETVASWGSLAATGGSAPGDLVAQSAMNINFGGLDSSAITEVRFVVNSAANVDSIFDNIETSPVPLPAAAYLFGTAVLGLVGVSRRRKAAKA